MKPGRVVQLLEHCAGGVDHMGDGAQVVAQHTHQLPAALAIVLDQCGRGVVGRAAQPQDALGLCREPS